MGGGVSTILDLGLSEPFCLQNPLSWCSSVGASLMLIRLTL